MQRSRSTIELNLKDARDYVMKLEAELAETHPTDLSLTTMYGDSTVKVTKSGKAIYVAVDGRSNKGLTAEKVRQLRDWLNYHFPKENA